MRVICPRCQAENQLPDTLDRKTVYRCSLCKKRFADISNASFGKVAVLAWIAWCAVSALVWGSVFLAPGAGESSVELKMAELAWMSSIAIVVGATVVTVFFLIEGLAHRKFTGVSPEGFWCLVLAFVLGAPACMAASGLAFAWWGWWT